MQELEFLNRLMSNKLAINPARVLLHIKLNQWCHQKDMLKPLNMSRAVLSQCCQLLLNRELIIQTGSYVSKMHSLTEKGNKLVEIVINENN